MKERELQIVFLTMKILKKEDPRKAANSSVLA